MSKPTIEETLDEVLTELANGCDDELFACKQEELEGYWHFKWDESRSAEWNVYEFHEMLQLYGNFCRRWEDHHHGYICIVERVRDKYLMPKIKELIEKLKEGGVQ